jgi:diguanylate cyclase (GGDEF)-like protein
MNDSARTKADLVGEIKGLRNRVSELEAMLASRGDEKQAGCEANYDPVTGLPGRVLLDDRLDVAITQARRYKRNVVIMVVHVANFKEILRQVGTRVADRFLRAFAERLRSAMRNADTVGSVDMNDFMLVLPDLLRMKDATEVAKKILGIFRRSFSYDNYTLHVNLNIGIAIYPKDGEEIDPLVANAYAAAESARRIGENTYYYHNSMRNIDELIGA